MEEIQACYQLEKRHHNNSISTSNLGKPSIFIKMPICEVN